MLEIGITGLATLNACYSHVLLLLQVEASSIFLQKDSADGALQAAVFPQASGRVEDLLLGHRYRLCGDFTDMNETTVRIQLQPRLGVSLVPVHSHAFHEPSQSPL